ncbi:rhomboid family intramembrane serine protease [Lentibacillus halophilus]|uniref:Rhomboid family intramembrane serine protease n=1 Tax=Lentibacillus halophilus TaxID=295065 RepID=A0ABN0Z3J9_9BACI
MFVRNERSIKEFMHLYPVVSWLVIINLGLWLLNSLLPFGNTIQGLGSGVNFLISQGEYWRLFTSMVLHKTLMHALFNSFAIVLFGPALEQMLGKWKFILAYVGTGFIGNLATVLLGPAIYASVGASGAIYGLFGIYVFMVAFRKHLIDQSSAQVITIIFIIGLVMTFIRPGINVYAHVFGFIGGFAIAPMVLNNVRPYAPWRYRNYGNDGSIQFNPNRWQKKQRNQKLFKNILWIAIGILVLLALIGRIF